MVLLRILPAVGSRRIQRAGNAWVREVSQGMEQAAIPAVPAAQGPGRGWAWAAMPMAATMVRRTAEDLSSGEAAQAPAEGRRGGPRARATRGLTHRGT